jgi:hypothetical protein
MATALANWIQTKAQLSAERASVIYAMEPVYGALFSYALLGETLNGVPGWVGAGLITLAASTNAFFDPTSDMVGHNRSAGNQRNHNYRLGRGNGMSIYRVLSQVIHLRGIRMLADTQLSAFWYVLSGRSTRRLPGFWID